MDYDTDRYDLTAAYGNERTQVQVGYTYSQFTDNATLFNAQNPFAFTPTTSFGGSVAGLTAPYTLPPSNSAHQLRALFGYNITPTMRLNVNLGYGLDMQNAPYQVGTGNPNVALQTVPRSSFDGLIQTYLANIALTAQPLHNLDVRLAYTMYGNDNQSPRNLYTTVNPTGTATGTFSYYNLPFSYQHQTVTAEAGYRLGPQTKVTVTDTFDDTYRTYTDTSVVTSNRIGAKLRGPLFSGLFGTLSYAHEDRVAHNYNVNGWWQSACPTCTDKEPANFLMFFEASREHDEVRSTLDASPTNNLTASLIVRFANDFYPNSTYGLRNNHNLTVGPDVSWQMTKSLSAHTFYEYQQIYYSQSSLYTTSGWIVPYTANTTDSVQTLGANLDWQAIPDVLKISLDYNFAYGDTAYALGEGVVTMGGTITNPVTVANLNIQPLPDVKSMLSVVSLRGEYTFRPNMTLLFGYAWERFTYKDFMVGTSATQYSNALLPGTLVPNNSVHVISAALRVRF